MNSQFLISLMYGMWTESPVCDHVCLHVSFKKSIVAKTPAASVYMVSIP